MNNVYMLEDSFNLIDYSESFADSILAQGKDNNFISIEKLPHPYKRADGKRVSYQMDYRWLSAPCENSSDQSWCCVQGQEFSYWSEKELKDLGLKLNSKNIIPEDYSIFDHVNLS